MEGLTYVQISVSTYESAAFKSFVLLEFIAPSYVQMLSDIRLNGEGVSQFHLSQGQLTGWDLTALK